MIEQTFSVFENNTIEASLQTGAISPNRILASLQADSLQQIDQETFAMQYRALSQSLVYQQGPLGQVVTDFSRSGVLRKSADLLKNITIMADHEFSAGRYLGKVAETHWTRKINETELPGLNALIYFDDDPQAEKAIQRALRGVKKNYLNGFSVSVWFEYERSHPDLDPLEFYDRMGSELDGEIIRFIATNILRYLEGSVVVAGADLHAGPLRSTQNAASLAASFSPIHGWSVPKTAQVTVSTNIKSHDAELFARAVEDGFMARKKKTDLDVAVEEDQVTEDLHEEDEEEKKTVSSEEDVETVETPETPETEDTQESDVAENTVNVNITSQPGFSQADLDAAVEKAVAAKEAELTAERIKTENLEKTQHRTELTTFWTDLKRDNAVAASFDELHIVDFMVGLSAEAADGNPSQLEQFKAILREVAKFAKVPTTPVGDEAKEPHGASDKVALRKAAIKQKLDEDTSGKRSEAEAMRLAAQDNPDLFREGD